MQVANSYSGELVKRYLWWGRDFVMLRFKSEPDPMVGDPVSDDDGTGSKMNLSIHNLIPYAY